MALYIQARAKSPASLRRFVLDLRLRLPRLALASIIRRLIARNDARLSLHCGLLIFGSIR
jgi:hypothetical protein